MYDNKENIFRRDYVDELRKTTVKCKCGNEFILTSEDSDDNPV
jgi:hypothetical protein